MKVIMNNKTFEYASLIVTQPWAFANEFLWNLIQKFKFDFLENKFWYNWCVCHHASIFQKWVVRKQDVLRLELLLLF